MLKSYQSIYVTVYRWIFRNFGQGSIPQVKSLFNVSFLLIIVLTNVMLFTKLMLKAQLLTLNINTGMFIMLGAIFLLLLNHFILLNNRWFKKLNVQLAFISRHNLNVWSVILLVNVVIACGFCLM